MCHAEPAGLKATPRLTAGFVSALALAACGAQPTAPTPPTGPQPNFIITRGMNVVAVGGRTELSTVAFTRVSDPTGWTHTLIPNAGGFVTIVYETVSAPIAAGQTLSFGYTASGSPAPVDWIANGTGGERFSGRVTGAGL